jgi:hypothetical protein
MDAPSRPVPLALRVGLVALELFTAAGAFYGGGMLIADPSGQKIGFSLPMLERTPFTSYLVPGLVLFGMNGLGMLCVAATVAFGWRRAIDASLVAGALLAAWVAAQVAMIGYLSALQPIMFAVGVLIAGLGVAARRSGGGAPSPGR